MNIILIIFIAILIFVGAVFTVAVIAITPKKEFPKTLTPDPKLLDPPMNKEETRL